MELQEGRISRKRNLGSGRERKGGNRKMPGASQPEMEEAEKYDI